MNITLHCSKTTVPERFGSLPLFLSAGSSAYRPAWNTPAVGIYHLEIGAIQRSSKLIYDRAHLAIADVKPKSIPWKEKFSEAKWFHFTGITPAISQSAADVCLEAVRSAKDKGLTVRCLDDRAKGAMSMPIPRYRQSRFRRKKA